MSDVLDKISDLISDSKEYVDSQIELAKLEFAEKTAKSAANVTYNAIIGLAATLIAVFLGIALAFYLGEELNSLAAGFLATAGIYLVLIFLLYLLRKPLIKRPIANKIIKRFFNPDSKNDL